MSIFKRLTAVVLSLAIILSMLLFTPNISAATTNKNQSLSIKANCMYDQAFEVLKQLNAYRKTKGLKELKMNSTLLENAMQRSAEIAVSFGHTRPDGSKSYTVNANGEINAENIGYAYKDATDVVNGWKSSSLHNANMLNNTYTAIGIGAIEHNGRKYWVQEFGRQTSDYTTTAPQNAEKAFNIKMGSNTVELDFSMPQRSFATDITEIQVIGKNKSAEINAYFVIDNDSLTYKSSDTSVISTNCGVATMLKKGSATVTATNKAVTLTKTIKVEDFGGTASKKCGDNITWKYNNGTLTFSGSGDMYDYQSTYTNDGEMLSTNLPYKDAFEYVNKVVVEEGITSIGNSAFTFFDALQEVELPSTLTSIGDNAFAFCGSLKSIVIPNSVTTLGKDTFRKCMALESITLPKKLQEIPVGMLYSCTSLKSIEIPSTIKAIGQSAFAYCTALEAVTLPQGIKSIGLLAFVGCTKITEMTIPYSVTNIANKAFMDCKTLQKVTINNPATIFEDSAIFSGTPSTLIVYGYLESSAQKYCTQNKLTFQKLTGKQLVVKASGYTFTYNAQSASSDITISTNAVSHYVRYSKGSGFDYNTNFGSIAELSKYYREDIAYDKRIAGYLLDSGTYPVSFCVTSNGYEPYTGTVNIVIEKAQPQFYFENESAHMFYYKGADNSAGYMNPLLERGSIQDVDLKFTTTDTQIVALDWHGKAVAKNYGECTVTATFDGNNNYYPHSASYNLKINPVGKIKIDAYTYNFHDDMTASISFYQGNTDEVTVPTTILDYTIDTVDEQAFFSRSFETLSIPKGIKTISDKAFLSSYLLSKLTIADSVQYIGDYAFAGCKKLYSVFVPKSVTHICEKAFGYTAPNANGECQKIDGFSITGYINSAAQEYANKHGFEFLILGDVNSDNTLTIMDATIIQRVLAKKEQFTSDQTETLADFNLDGVITVTDATKLQRVLAKKE